jgi:hypothetical protein
LTTRRWRSRRPPADGKNAQRLSRRRLDIVAGDFVDMTTSYYLILPETRASASAVQAFAKWLTAEARIFNARGGRRAASKKPAEHRPNGAPEMTKIPLDVGDAARPRTIA